MTDDPIQTALRAAALRIEPAVCEGSCFVPADVSCDRCGGYARERAAAAIAAFLRALPPGGMTFAAHGSHQMTLVARDASGRLFDIPDLAAAVDAAAAEVPDAE